MTKKCQYFLIILLSSCFLSFSQGYVPRIIDTVVSGKDRVILFENHTWSYFGIASRYDSLITNSSVFDSFWSCDELFPCRMKKSPYPDYVELNLIAPGDSFTLPVSGRLWGAFNNWHPGLDIELQHGDPVKAAFAGKVRYAQYNRGGYGNLVIIRHYNGLETYYAHLSQIWVAPEQIVKSGDVVGLGGATGRARGTHLHFETRYLDRPFDPLSFIDMDNKKLTKTMLIIDSRNQPNSNTVQPQNPESIVYYSIRSGDTLSTIAHRCGTSVSQLCRINNITPRTILRVGRTIRIR